MLIGIKIATNTPTYETGGPGGTVHGSLDQSVHWAGVDDGTPGSADRFRAALIEHFGLPDLGEGDHGRPANGVADELGVVVLSAAMLYAYSRGIAPPIGEWVLVPGDGSDQVDIEAIYDLAFTAPGLGGWLRNVHAAMASDPAWTNSPAPHVKSPVRPGILQPKDVLWRFTPSAPPDGGVVDGHALTTAPLPVADWSAYYKAAAAQLAALKALGPLGVGERAVVDPDTYLRLFGPDAVSPLQAASTADLLAELGRRMPAA